MSGLNLHGIVFNAIGAVNPHETVEWYRSVPTVANGFDREPPKWREPLLIKAQIQSESEASLFHSDNVGKNSTSRKVYLFSRAKLKIQPSPNMRQVGRGGDVLRFPDGTWWAISAIVEQFSNVGWCSVRATMLNAKPPTIPEPEVYDDSHC